MSYNIKALFPFYNKLRIRAIVDYVESLFVNNQVDIVCLQEAFELDLYDHLYRVARENSLNIVHPPLSRKYYIGENSGLVTISRYPIIEHGFVRHETSGGLCSFANKGAHYVQYSVNRCTMNLVNTHLQSDNQKIAVRQLTRIMDSMTLDNTLLVGDMNMDYEILRKNVGDAFYLANDIKVITFPEDKTQYDYCIHKSWCETRFAVLSDILHSDHYPVLLTMVL
jgi:endonuclease/exonuclease/phosphatase family metal-dependent hydrolase